MKTMIDLYIFLVSKIDLGRLLTFSLIVTSPFFFFTCDDDEDMFMVDEPEQVDATELNAELLTSWTDVILQTECFAGGMRPNASARAMAYIYLAAYETVQPGMPGYRSHAGRLDELRLVPDQFTGQLNLELALNACLADVADHFLLNVSGNRKDSIRLLEEANYNRLRAALPETVITTSLNRGKYVARQIIAYSLTDAAAEQQVLEPQPRSYEPPTGPGYWTYSADPERALFPYWGEVRTFIVPTAQTTTVPPLPYSTEVGSPFREQMEEVYEANNAARAEDGEQLWIAEFWSDDVESVMMSPPARQVAIASQLIEQFNLDLAAALALMAKVGFAINDAAVATWKYKYQHMVMRPSAYIREVIDPDYRTNLFRFISWPDPSFPGYPSGHSTFASAAGGIFIETFGDQTDFTDRTHEGRVEFRGMPRTFSSFTDMINENAYSRIPLGVHIRMDCDEGVRLGYEIADGVNQWQLRE